MAIHENNLFYLWVDSNMSIVKGGQKLIENFTVTMIEGNLITLDKIKMFFVERYPLS